MTAVEIHHACAGFNSLGPVIFMLYICLWDRGEMRIMWVGFITLGVEPKNMVAPREGASFGGRLGPQERRFRMCVPFHT